MKPVQILAVLVTLVVGLFVISSIMNQSTPAVSQTQAHGSSKPEDAKLVGEEGQKFYSSNPFPLDTTGKDVPVAEIPEASHMFGSMSIGATKSHDFIVKNTGKVALKLARGPAQCKCTLSGLTEEVVEPGQEVKIHLSWTPTETGPFHQEAVIWSNDPKNPRLVFDVQGELFPALVITPTPGWNLGSVPNSDPIELPGMLESSIYEHFNITGITSSSELLTLEATEMTPEQLVLNNRKSGYHLKLKFAGTDKPGQINEKVTLETDLEDNKTINFDVIGNRTGAMSVIGPNWYTAGPLIDLGLVDPAKGKEVKLTVMIEPGEEELKFSDIEISPGFVQVRLQPEHVGKELARERYSLFVTVPPNSPKGIWNSSRPGHIALKMNHPKISELDIKLHLSIE